MHDEPVQLDEAIHSSGDIVMMTNCFALMGSMGWLGWLMPLAVLSLLGLGIAALLKYLFASNPTPPRNGANP